MFGTLQPMFEVLEVPLAAGGGGGGGGGGTETLVRHVRHLPLIHGSQFTAELVVRHQFYLSWHDWRRGLGLWLWEGALLPVLGWLFGGPTPKSNKAGGVGPGAPLGGLSFFSTYELLRLAIIAAIEVGRSVGSVGLREWTPKV